VRASVVDTCGVDNNHKLITLSRQTSTPVRRQRSKSSSPNIINRRFSAGGVAKILIKVRASKGLCLLVSDVRR